MRIIGEGPDPSLVYRPNLQPSNAKDKTTFRNYEGGELHDRVFNTYRLMHTHQTLDFIKQKHIQWSSCSHAKLTMMEAIELLDKLVDESDPDVDFPNSFHAFQTAEGIRQQHPDKGHDQNLRSESANSPKTRPSLQTGSSWSDSSTMLGKLWLCGESLRFQDSIVFRDSTFSENPDFKQSAFSSEYGVYKPNCGLENVTMSWGHDEYLYQVLKFNKCPIPEEGMYIIRFHSFYPWHHHGDYMHLCDDKDMRMLPWVKEFNKFDLYTKSDRLLDAATLRQHYQQLIDKFCPGVLSW
ncbi:inositol oxygenase isoform X1 [Denticeps clupeoides]|uniref:inositol oxygenase isoform X1 n=1 Tax=Denticeps clupeoides TaxID=299321 RepID=UPI0010A46313|nr:inositol oxygenase isoform X1 [Denticeps clupeoides]